MLNKLTIIIPTRNRYKSVLKQINYIKDWGSEIFVLDGSDKKNNFFENFSKQNSQIKYYHSRDGIFTRFKFMKNKINTKYAMLMADDEFFIKNTLEKCIDFLDKNSEYVSCSGFSIGFKKSLNKKLIYKKMYTRLIEYKIDKENSKERIIDHMSKYVPCSVYGVLNSRVFNKFLKELDFSNTSCPETFELWVQNTVAYMGNIKVLPALYWFRNLENSPVQEENWKRTIKFYEWYNKKKFQREVDYFIESFCNLNNDISKDLFKKALTIFSKDLNKRKGQGTLKLAIRLFFKRSINFFFRRLGLFGLITHLNEKSFFDFEVFKKFMNDNKITYDTESIKQIEKVICNNN